MVRHPAAHLCDAAGVDRRADAARQVPVRHADTRGAAAGARVLRPVDRDDAHRGPPAVDHAADPQPYPSRTDHPV